MKYLISTTGSKIPFMLDAKKKFVFDPIVPVEIEDADFPSLNKRLGVQLQEVSVGYKPTKVSVEKPTVMDADEDSEEKDVDDEE